MLIFILLLIGTSAVLSILLRQPDIQAKIKNEAVLFLSKKLDTKVGIDSIYITFFNKVSIDGVYLEDKNKDTLAYIGNFQTNLLYINPFKNKYYLKNIYLNDVKAYIYRTENDSIFNYDFLLKAFASNNKNTKTAKKSAPFDFRISTLEIKNADIVFDDPYGGQGHFIRFEELHADVDHIKLMEKDFKLDNVFLKNPNYTFTTYFHKPKTKPSKTFHVDLGIKLGVDDLEIVGGKFAMYDKTKPLKKPGTGFDFTNFAVDITRVKLKDYVWNKQMAVNIEDIRVASPANGVVVKELKGKAQFSDEGIAAEDMTVRYNNSILRTDALLSYNSLDDFSDFLNKVYIKADIYEAKTNGEDVGVWASVAKKYVPSVALKGKFYGTVSNITGENFEIKAEKNTYINGTANIKGLPDSKKMIIDAKINNLSTNSQELAQIIPYVKLPKELQQLGNIAFKGNFHGHYDDFNADGALITDKGLVSSDIKLAFHKGGTATYSGKIGTRDLNLGEILNVKDLGRISMDFVLDGNNFNINTLRTVLNGKINSVEYKGYTYRDIAINGFLNQKSFKGKVKVNDPNVHLDFDGYADFRDSKNPHFDFYTHINKANLATLHLVKKPLTVSLEGDFRFDGINPNEITGRGDISSILIADDSSEYAFKDILLCMDKFGDEKQYSLQSKEISADISGVFDINTIALSVQNYLSEYSTLIKPPKLPKNMTWQKLDSFSNSLVAKINIDKNFSLLKMFVPKTQLLSDIYINADFNSRQRSIFADIRADSFAYDKIKLYTIGLQLTDGKGDKNLYLDGSISSLASGKTVVNDIILKDKINIQKQELFAKINPDTAKNALSLYSDVRFENKDIIFNFNDAKLKINNKFWTIPTNNQLIIRDSLFITKNIILVQGNQKITVRDGENSLQNAGLTLDYINIPDLVQLIDTTGFVKNGLLNGRVNIKNVNDKMAVDGEIVINNLQIADIYVDFIGLDAAYSAKNNLVYYSGRFDDPNYDLTLEGTYDLSKEAKSPLKADVDISKLSLSFLALPQILGKEISNLSALTTGKLSVSGSPKQPIVDGEVKTIDTSSVHVNYLGMDVSFVNEDIKLSKNKIDLKTITLYDRYGNNALLTAVLEHDYFRTWDLDVQINTPKFNFLNTTYKDNKDFWGLVNASGLVTIKGPTDNLELDINATTLPNTVFNINTSNNTDDKTVEFIKYINKKDTFIKKEIEVKRKGKMTLNMDLVATPDALLNLYLDYAKNDVIKARGNALLQLEIADKMTMSGDFIADDGEYLFSQQDLINKKFKIRKGSKIHWGGGDVMNADMDVDAVLNVKANMRGIVDSTSSLYNTKVPIDAVVHIGGTLSDTKIEFLIEPTQGTTADLGELNSLLLEINSNEGKRNQQFFWLLMTGGFQDISNIDKNFGIDLAFNTMSDFISNKINNNINDLISVLIPGAEINLQVGLDATSLLLTQKLFNDRLIINIGGNVQYGNTGVAQNNSGIAGDFEIQYLINQEGNLKFNTYSKYNNNNVIQIDQSKLRAGVGISYEKEFNKAGENLKEKRKKKREEKLPPPQPIVPPKQED